MIPLPALSWIKVLQWVGVAAAIVALIGVPVVYHNHQVSQAYEQGKVVGRAECEKNVVAQKEIQLKRQQEIMLEESQKAQALQEKLQKTEIAASKLEQKLNVELSKNSQVVGCLLPRNATDLLRDAAEGDFDSIKADALSGDQPLEMPGRSSLLKEGGDRSS